MADDKKPAQPEFPVTPISLIAGLAGWIVPGGGHFLLKKWWRGTFLLVSITLMFGIGVWMDGKVYTPNTGDILDMLGFVGDVSSGLLYMMARAMDWGKGAPAMASAAYGTAYIICSGMLNLVSAFDAYHIGLGKKP